jgi:hypothetical protein
MIKVDLHVHTKASIDSLTSLENLEQIFESEKVDQIAITDHDEIDFAKRAQSKFGKDRIIVGQEITLDSGNHLIGLFIREFIPTGLSAERTAQLIKNQNGIVYVPHPYEDANGVGQEVLENLRKKRMIDVIEGFNSWNRPVFPIKIGQNKQANDKALKFAEKHGIPHVSASDAHTDGDIGTATIEVEKPLTKQNFLEQISSEDTKFNRQNSKVTLKHIAARLKYYKTKIPFIN